MNIAIVSIVLKEFCKPFIDDLNNYNYYPTTEDKFEAVRNAAEDSNNEEIIEILNWIEEKNLQATFFPEQI